MTFALDNIDEYQIEVTTYCNAACPQCPRNINGKGTNPHMPLTHLARQVIDKTFPAELCERLRQIFFCGSYGDPIMHPDFLDILQDFRNKNSTLWLYIHTNGGVRTNKFWRKVAEIMNGHGQIDFGIDGLADTLHLYRRQVQFDRLIANARAFIEAGGRAQWNFLVFRHNEHQIDQVKTMASDLGFHSVLIRRTGRFLDHERLVELPSWPTPDPGFDLEPPTASQYRNKSMINLPLLKQQQDIETYFRTTPIECDALLGHKVAVNAEGIVLPCNFFNHNLYDARFYDNSLPRRHQLSMVGDRTQVRAFLEKYGLDQLNIHHYTLSEIFANPFWQDLVQSWTSSSRLFECAMTCGKKFRKVWDQGGNNL